MQIWWNLPSLTLQLLRVLNKTNKDFMYRTTDTRFSIGMARITRSKRLKSRNFITLAGCRDLKPYKQGHIMFLWVPGNFENSVASFRNTELYTWKADFSSKSEAKHGGNWRQSCASVSVPLRARSTKRQLNARVRGLKLTHEIKMPSISAMFGFTFWLRSWMKSAFHVYSSVFRNASNHRTEN